MTSKITVEDKGLKLEITSANGDLFADDPAINQLIALADNLNTVLPMEKLKLDKKGNGDFDYELTANDGRQWKQVLKIDSLDAAMNFDVDDYFRLSEFAAHRQIRDLAVGMVVIHRVEKITLDWK